MQHKKKKRKNFFSCCFLFLRTWDFEFLFAAREFHCFRHCSLQFSKEAKRIKLTNKKEILRIYIYKQKYVVSKQVIFAHRWPRSTTATSGALLTEHRFRSDIMQDTHAKKKWNVWTTKNRNKSDQRKNCAT